MKNKESILVINISDSGHLGKKVADSLKNVNQSIEKPNVKLVQLQNQAIQWKELNEVALDESESAIEYDKIILCAHGLINDTDNCYTEHFSAEEGKYVQLMNFSELAAFFQSVLKKLNIDNSKPQNILLSMCYAARGENYTANHSNFNQETHKTSFAYKFCTELSKRLNTGCLTSATGAVRFNPFCHDQENILLVQTEEQILAQRNVYPNLEIASKATSDALEKATIKSDKVQALQENTNEIQKAEFDLIETIYKKALKDYENVSKQLTEYQEDQEILAEYYGQVKYTIDGINNIIIQPVEFKHDLNEDLENSNHLSRFELSTRCSLL